MTDGSNAVALPAIIDLDALDTVRDQLLDAVEAGPVTVNGAAVERVSTNALLMLVSAAETARRNSLPFAVESPSEQMIASIDRLGFTASFSSMIKESA